MKLKNEKLWDIWAKNNKDDAYSKCCVDIAKRVMELLDENDTPLRNGYHPDIYTAHGLICKADKDIDAGGITGFMEGAVAQMVSGCHERGEEFRKSWNGNIDEKYDGEGVLNPALIRVSTGKKENE